MLLELSGLILGLIGLWLGTKWTIDNAILIAERHRLSDAFVGMGILAIGTDLPELMVAINAGLRGMQGDETSGMIVGSSIGSAFAQIGLVMGVLGFSGYLMLGKEFLKRHGSILIGSIVILWLVGYDRTISRVDGIILLLIFAVYYYLLVTQEEPSVSERKQEIMQSSWPPAILLAGGIITVIAASELCVFSATSLAQRLGVPQILVALLIVGVGTSLPELGISLAAIRKKKTALSVGNLIGSNIFDTLVPISVAAMLTPVKMDTEMLYFDLPLLALLSLLVLTFFSHKKGLQKREAIIIIVGYMLYAIASLVLRSTH